MRALHRVSPLIVALLLTTACTSGSGSDRPQPSASPGAGSPTSPAGATLADGSPMPGSCVGEAAKARQSVAFVAEGAAWAVDPRGNRLSCLFEVNAAGPFAWGPQGDRVLLGGLEVRGLSGDDPNLASNGQRARVFDWGHPLGLAVVYATPSDRTPEKRFMDDGRVERLDGLPRATYRHVAYHPSGLALAFVVDRGGRQRILLSTNEGLDPVPLVFSEGGTRFTSIAFTPDGQSLVWTAQHAGGYPQIHAMDLAHRTGFTDGWRGEIGQEVSNLRLPPSGDALAFDVGATCEDRAAMIALNDRVARRALPDAGEPTTALGWLDDTTVLVAVGGCGETLDVVAVDVTGTATPVVLGVDAAAARTVTTSWPTSVPAPPADAEEQPPPEGVG